jgi:endoribonuclease Dicer
VICHDLTNIIIKAVVDAVVMTYLFKKFPRANSGQLSSLRARAVCGPALAFIAVRVLNLHTFLLADHPGLAAAVEKYIPTLQATSSRDIVLQSWAHDPPKVLSDIFESLVAAVLIDSGYNFDKTMCIVETAMESILEVLSPDLPPEPVSAFYLWAAKSGCKRIHLRYVSPDAVCPYSLHIEARLGNHAVVLNKSETTPSVLSYMIQSS